VVVWAAGRRIHRRADLPGCLCRGYASRTRLETSDVDHHDASVRSSLRDQLPSLSPSEDFAIPSMVIAGYQAWATTRVHRAREHRGTVIVALWQVSPFTDPRERRYSVIAPSQPQATATVA
jgi:hypothetical protein